MSHPIGVLLFGIITMACQVTVMLIAAAGLCLSVAGMVALRRAEREI